MAEQKKEYVSISKSEREVLAVLWASEEPLKASDVADILAPQTGWSLSTTRTFLKRLEKKGAVTTRTAKNKRAALYVPLLDENDVRVAEGESLLEKYFNGTLCGLTSCFIERERVSDDELRQLRDIIDQKLNEKSEKTSKTSKKTRK